MVKIFMSEWSEKKFDNLSRFELITLRCRCTAQPTELSGEPNRSCSFCTDARTTLYISMEDGCMEVNVRNIVHVKCR